MHLAAILHTLFALVFAPFLLSMINRTKAIVAGRTGQPLLQPYSDLWKLLQKGAVYSRTTTWVFRAGPVVGLAAVLTALLVMPFGGARAPVAFSGDLLFFAYVLGLLRVMTVFAALDTGSSFEGMGASREVTFSALAEPALLLGLAVLARQTDSLSLSTMFAGITSDLWRGSGPALALISLAFFIVFLTENARMPIDDPTTHLELTMIHEVMILDHGGPDLAYILYGNALKLWILGSLLVGIIMPVRSGHVWLDNSVACVAIVGVAILTGLIESAMARLRLLHVPQLLVGAGVLSALALVLVLR